MTMDQLHRVFYVGGGPALPYECRRCGSRFAVSDQRREHEHEHERRKAQAKEE